MHSATLISIAIDTFVALLSSLGTFHFFEVFAPDVILTNCLTNRIGQSAYYLLAIQGIIV